MGICFGSLFYVVGLDVLSNKAIINSLFTLALCFGCLYYMPLPLCAMDIGLPTVNVAFPSHIDIRFFFYRNLKFNMLIDNCN